MLFAHSLAAFLLTLSGRLVTAPYPRGWLLGLALGWAAITEYALAPLAIAAAAVAWRWWPSFYLGAAVPLAAAGLYNWAAFGAPWQTGYHFQATFSAARDIGSHLGGPLLPGLRVFVLGGKDTWGSHNKGLLALAPVLALWPLGLFVMARRLRWQALLLGTVCAAYLVLYSKHVAFGAGTNDSRYFVPFLPLALVAIGHLVARVGWPAWAAVAALAAVGVTQLVPHINGSFGWRRGRVALHSPALRSAYMQLGLVFELRRDDARAATAYEIALRDAPYTSAGARGNLGAIRLAQGRGEEASAQLTAALTETPDDPRVLTNLGTVYLQQQRFDAAAQLLARAVGLDPDSPQAHDNLGVALAQQQHYAEAAVHFERVLALDPRYPYAGRSLVFVREAMGARR